MSKGEKRRGRGEEEEGRGREGRRGEEGRGNERGRGEEGRGKERGRGEERRGGGKSDFRLVSDDTDGLSFHSAESHDDVLGIFWHYFIKVFFVQYLSNNLFL